MNEKLEEISEEKRKETDIFVINVGACEFPVNSDTELDMIYTKYVEQLHGIVSTYPYANIIMSSVLPRSGEGKEDINSQIRIFNERLLTLSSQELCLHYCDNDVHFNTEEGVNSTLYRDTETVGIHLNQEGKKRLESSITACIKEMYFALKWMGETPSV